MNIENYLWLCPWFSKCVWLKWSHIFNWSCEWGYKRQKKTIFWNYNFFQDFWILTSLTTSTVDFKFKCWRKDIYLATLWNQEHYFLCCQMFLVTSSSYFSSFLFRTDCIRHNKWYRIMPPRSFSHRASKNLLCSS